MHEIPNCFYRVSIKGLILNNTRDKFLIVQEDNGRWELPGGGLDWGENPQRGLEREIKEEMGLEVTHVSAVPAYLVTFQKKPNDIWVANVLFEVSVPNLDFRPSEECIALRFVSPEEVRELDTFSNVQILADMFNPAYHQPKE